MKEERDPMPKLRIAGFTAVEGDESYGPYEVVPNPRPKKVKADPGDVLPPVSAWGESDEPPGGFS